MEAFKVSGVMVAIKAPNTGSTQVCFGLFEFDFSTRELRKQGRRLKLQEFAASASHIAAPSARRAGHLRKAP